MPGGFFSQSAKKMSMGALSTAEGFAAFQEMSPGFTAECRHTPHSHQGP